MADNTTLSAGAGGDTIATDDIGGVKHQRVKIQVGPDGSAADVIPAAAGMDTTGGGIPPAAILAQLDDTSTATVTEDRFAPVRLSSRRALLVEGVASGTAQPISAAALPLPSGAATEAKQDTIIGHVDGIEGFLATLAGAVAGTEIQADVLTMPTGANASEVQGTIAHGTADAQKPVKIGGKALVASAATPTPVDVGDRVDGWFETDGTQVVGNREAAREDATWDSGTAGDTALTIDCSRMGTVVGWIAPSGSITGGALTFECSWDEGTTWVPLSGSNGNRMQTGVLLTGSDYWNGSTAGWRFMSHGMDLIRIRLSTAISGTGEVVVSLRGLSMGSAHGLVARHQFRQQEEIITTTGTSVIDLEGTQGSPCLRIANSGSAWSGTIVFEMSPDGSNWYPAIAQNVNTYAGTEFQTTANGAWEFYVASGMRYMRVRGASVTNNASIFWSVGSVGASLTNTIVSGDKANDATDLSTFPVKVGMRAIGHGSNPTAVAADDRVNWYANRAGVPWVIGGHPNIQTVEYRATTSDDDVDLLGAISAGTKYVITMLQVYVSNATTVNVGVRIGFGASATPTEPADANRVAGMIFAHDGIAPGSGVVIGNGGGIIGIGGDGLELRMDSDAPTSGDLRVVVTYYTIES